MDEEAEMREEVVGVRKEVVGLREEVVGVREEEEMATNCSLRCDGSEQPVKVSNICNLQ